MEHFPKEPSELWKHFYQFTQIPRPSKHEEKIQAHLISLAKENGCDYQVDEENNVVIYVPGTQGFEDRPPVIIQNHTDMVTDSTPGHQIDFTKDPIETFVDGDWLKAKNTTLGADNGIGCAAALALLTDKTVSHPPLELLFTTDEETGLNGAWGVKSEFFKGKKMLNLDTEEWGALYTGCAGGIDYEMTRKIDFQQANKNHSFYKVTLGGLRGGHSGVDIHMQLGNAVKMMGEVLFELKEFDFELSEIRSGRAHNIIPRDAFAVIAIDPSKEEKLDLVLSEIVKRWKSYLGKDDQEIFLKLDKLSESSEVLSRDNRDLCINALNLFPHGAHTYFKEADEDLVALSNNLAICLLANGHFYLLTSIRFFDRQEAVSVEHSVQSLASSFAMEVKKNGEYPSWKPALESKLLDQVKATYKECFGDEPRVTAIHAGLECGILRDRIGPIDAISFGPTIMGAHSPQERVNINTVTKFWDFLKAVIVKV